MLCTDKDLGLVILQYDRLEIENNERFVPIFIGNNSYGLVLAKTNNYYEWDFLTDESFDFFIENFTLVKHLTTGVNYGFLSDLYNLYFDADEESFLYWNLKYKIKD